MSPAGSTPERLPGGGGCCCGGGVRSARWARCARWAARGILFAIAAIPGPGYARMSAREAPVSRAAHVAADAAARVATEDAAGAVDAVDAAGAVDTNATAETEAAADTEAAPNANAIAEADAATGTLGATPALAGGGKIRLADGRVVPWEAARIRSGRLVVSVPGAAEAEWSVPLEFVAALACPEPPALVEAREALARGDALDAIVGAGAVARQFDAWRTTPGSWWSAARTLQLRARARLGQWSELARDAAAFAGGPADGEAGQWERLARAHLAGRTDGAEAEATRSRDESRTALRAILLAPATPEIEVEAALALGEDALRGREWTEALDALLRVPVFHPERLDRLPRVWLLCARAYAGLEDRGREERTLLGLADAHPDAPETAQARREFAGRFP